MMDDGNGNKKAAAFNKLVGRALEDSDFRLQLKDRGSREQAVSQILREHDLEYSAIETELDDAVEAVEKLARKFGADLRIAS
jgi:hypothetical protein